jgi:galactonate dehydratase
MKIAAVKTAVANAKLRNRICDTFGVSMAPHNPLGPVATMVNIHLGFALPNFLIQPVRRADAPWRDEVVAGVTPIEIDFMAAARHPFAEAPPVRWRHHDGAVADW